MNVFTWLYETISLPAALICVGALLSTVGALWASAEQDKVQKAAEQKTQEIKQLNTQILALSEENKHLAKEGISTVTGGDGFVYVDIIKGLYQYAYAPIVISTSEYPQYDISIRFYDEQKDHDLQISQPIILNIATLPAGQSSYHKIPAFDLSGKSDFAKFNLFISARNGSFIEELRLKRIGDDWFSAVRIYRIKSGNKDQLLFENAMENYPRNVDGSLVW